MITFKISGAKYLIPTAWGDVTFLQQSELLKSDNTLLAYISIFTKIPRETLAKAELKNLEKIALALSFLTVPPKFEYDKPTEMVGPWVLPKDVTVQSVAQFEDLRGLMNNIPPEIIQKIIDKVPITTADGLILNDFYLEACAIYVQKLADRSYDHTQVEKYKQQLKNYSASEIIQTGAFFLFRPLSILKTTRSRYQNILPRLKRLLQDLPGYQKSLDFLLHSSRQVKK
jgi:hypothetical protein